MWRNSTSWETIKTPPTNRIASGEVRKLLSFEEVSPSVAVTPIAKAMEYAERAEYMHIAPGQATVSALLALFWLKVAELESRGVSMAGESAANSATTD